MSQDFYSKSSYALRDLQTLIDIGAEESINLDFKASGSLDITEGKKSELAKDVSAFANSDGGIIIYGILEKDNKAHSFSYIDGNKFTKEWIEQVINSKIQRRIQDIVIYPVRVDNEVSKTIYIVKIPASYDAPHISSDKRYYKRFNFQSVQMEEYEIRELYNRQISKSEIIIVDPTIEPRSTASIFTGSDTQYRSVDYIVSFLIKNIGNTIEDKCKVEIRIHRDIYDSSFESTSRDSLRKEGEFLIFSIPTKVYIFQQETFKIFGIGLNITSNNVYTLEKNPVEVTLFYSKGLDKKSFNLSEKLYEPNGGSVKRLIQDVHWF